MGNSQGKKDPHGKYKMQIFLNKYNFFPDEILKGEIKLSCKEEDEDSDVPLVLTNPKISLRLIHKECYANPDIDAKNKKNENTIDEILGFDNIKTNVVFAKTELYSNFKNKDIRNILNIPFSIKIPTEIKPSFEYVNKNKSYAFSRIYLSIDIPESLNKKEVLIFIHKTPKPLESELTIIKYITKKKLGFIGSGSNISFQGSYPKNHYGFSETVPLNISLDIFGTKENIKGISFTLKRKICFMKNRTKAANEFIEDLWAHNIKENITQKNFNFNIPLVETEKIYSERKNMPFDMNIVNREDLICLLPSYDGELIKCQYYIFIKISYESLLIKDPDFEMPIDLGHSQTAFTQIFMLDVNKILLQLNKNVIKILMQDTNGDKNINKTQIDVKSKMSDIFGKSKQKNINKKDSINNINQTDFGNKNDININNKKDNNNSLNMSKVFGNVNPNYNKPLSNKKDAPTPNNNLSNSNNSNLSKSNSSNSSLPGENDIYTTKDEQAAPGLNNNNNNNINNNKKNT